MNGEIEKVLNDREDKSANIANPKQIRLKEESEPVLITLADVIREKVDWLWSDRLPLGKLTLIQGDPGLGKSWLTMALAKSITLGEPLPGDTEYREPSNVLLLNAEDGHGDTVRPRAEDLGADLSRIKILDYVLSPDGKERQFSITEHTKVLEGILANGGYSLLVIDPINAYLNGVDSHKDTELRGALMPLAKLAQKYKVAIICLMHLTKSAKDRAIYRGQGSIGYVGAARVVHLVGLNPDDKTKVVMIPIKNNLAPLAEGIEYSLGINGFKWGETTNVTASQLLLPDQEDVATLAIDEAKDFLLDILTEQGVESTELLRQAKAADISERTLNRAKAEYKLAGLVSKEKVGFADGGKWHWKLTLEGKAAKNISVKGKGNHKGWGEVIPDLEEVAV